MKKYYFLIIVALILGLVLTGCSLLSNVGQVPTSEQSGLSYLTKALPLANLVGLWHFDDNADDSSGNSYDGTLMGDTGWTSGKFGNALSFDGDGDYVQLPASNAILNTGIFTIEAWFKTSLEHPAEGAEGRLVTFYRLATPSTALSLYVEEDHIGLLYYTGTAHVWMEYIVDYHDSVWHHIAVTYDASTYKLYYDGEKVASQADAFGVFGTYPAFLGAYISTQRFFNGVIDEVRIWNTALDAKELCQFYDFNGLFSPYAAPPRAFKAGSSIPLKWQYTDLFGIAVDSSAANPLVEIKPVTGDGTPVEGDLITVVDPGLSGYQYDSLTTTWQYNWQTKGLTAGLYYIRITSGQTDQVNGPFPIQLR